MPFDDIPEDYRPSFACHECDEGNITESEEFPGVWECDTCSWSSEQSEPFNPPFGA